MLGPITDARIPKQIPARAACVNVALPVLICRATNNPGFTPVNRARVEPCIVIFAVIRELEGESKVSFFRFWAYVFAIAFLSASIAACGSSSSDDDDEGGVTEVTVSTVAGDGGEGYVDATGTAARFDEPKGITTDGTNLYVAGADNSRIRKIEIASAEVTTLVGDGTPNIADGIGVGAQLGGPDGITRIANTLFFTDSDAAAGSVVRGINLLTASVVTIAGDPATKAYLDGANNVARFSNPAGLVTDGINAYVADKGNHVIRRVGATDVITLAGNGFAGFADGIGGLAQFDSPSDVTGDGGNLYVVDTGNHAIRRVSLATFEVTTLAGDGTPGFRDTSGTDARFDTPLGITTDGTYLYVTDGLNQRIRRVEIASGRVSTIAGDGVAGSTDGVGTAARFNLPWGITIFDKTLYVTDKQGHLVRKIELP